MSKVLGMALGLIVRIHHVANGPLAKVGARAVRQILRRRLCRFGAMDCSLIGQRLRGRRRAMQRVSTRCLHNPTAKTRSQSPTTSPDKGPDSTGFVWTELHCAGGLTEAGTATQAFIGDGLVAHVDASC